jgi:hypothetical protein
VEQAALKEADGKRAVELGKVVDGERAGKPYDILASGNGGEIAGKLLEGTQGDLDALVGLEGGVFRHFLSYGFNRQRRRKIHLHHLNHRLLIASFASVGSSGETCGAAAPFLILSAA